jgi:hypothetical protein
MKNTQRSLCSFSKVNYLLLATSLLCILAGYGAMILDKTPYGFGTLSLTVGPILLIVGFILPFFAIMYRRKE